MKERDEAKGQVSEKRLTCVGEKLRRNGDEEDGIRLCEDEADGERGSNCLPGAYRPGWI